MPRRDATVKGIRALAHKEQMSFMDALAASDLPNWKKSSVTPVFKYPKTGNNMSSGKEADAYINKRGYLKKGKNVCLDDGSNDYDYPRDFGSHIAPRSSSLTLADVRTKVAKPKGIRKEYDWVDRVAPVLVLDDDIYSDDEWEDVYAEQQAMLNRSKKPYSAVTASAG